MGRANGISDEQLAGLKDYAQSPLFGEPERLVLDLAVAMAQLPADIPEELGGRLRSEFDEAQLVELASAIAWENHRARFNRVFGVASGGFSEGAVCAVPER